MTKIRAIGTAVPAYRHSQDEILQFMLRVYGLPETEQRKLRFLYRQSGIEHRYSVIPDYGRPVGDWRFYPASESLEPFPSLEWRMAWYQRYAPALSMEAIRHCLSQAGAQKSEVTHLITVSCTGMSAPGLDLELMELLELPRHLHRSSVNFMGCYAALHALKQADAYCRCDPQAQVLIVCTELCTLHFQKTPGADNIASSLLFGDGSAAVLVSGDPAHRGPALKGFYAEIVPGGKRDMSWELSSSGFLMTLSGYVPELIGADFQPLVRRALDHFGMPGEFVPDGWCIHPGGKRILQAVERSLALRPEALKDSYEVLRKYGNMSSPSILFVLKAMMEKGLKGNIIGAAFGPGLTMETCWLEAGEP